MAKNRFARYTRTAGAMNKLEAKYANEVLEVKKRAGEIREYFYESIKFRIGERCWYSPDFVVYHNDGFIEAHECKGFMEEDALVKIKAFQEKYMMPLILIKWEKKAWVYKTFEPKGDDVWEPNP